MKFRKKPIAIEAEQFFPDSLPHPLGLQRKVRKLPDGEAEEGWFLHEIGGAIVRVVSGDWVITGVEGEVYPCKPDIFEATYEKVEDD